jgi:hypothetical protein
MHSLRNVQRPANKVPKHLRLSLSYPHPPVSLLASSTQLPSMSRGPSSRRTHTPRCSQ